MVQSGGAAIESVWPGRPAFRLELPSGAALDLGRRPLVMGVLNVTPDSFSDGGRFFSHARAAERGRQMVAEGADIIDVGGESTRPGSDPVPADEELRRIIPVIEELAAESAVPISVDTQKARVAAEAIEAGAQIVNDVSALRTDPDMPAVVAESGVLLVLMHMQGTPRTMQRNPTYTEVVSDVARWLRERIDYAVGVGIQESRLVVDPGFGFGKTLQHNLELLRRLHEFHRLGRPLMVGTSRKSMIGAILDVPPGRRLLGSLATVACAVMAGCHIVRVHDVQASREVVAVCEAVRRGMDYEDA